MTLSMRGRGDGLCFRLSRAIFAGAGIDDVGASHRLARHEHSPGHVWYRNPKQQRSQQLFEHAISNPTNTAGRIANRSQANQRSATPIPPYSTQPGLSAS